MPYKVVACDFDDTLFPNSTHELTQKNVDAVRKCEQKGIRFVLATGRVYPSIKGFYDKLGLETPVITTGGAEIYDSSSRRIYFSRLEHKDAYAVLKRAKELGVHAHIYREDSFIFEKELPMVDLYVKHTGLKPVIEPDFMNFPLEWYETPKILLMAEPEHATLLQKQLSAEFPHLNVVKSLNYFVEFFDKKTSKGEALRYLVKYMGYSLDETVAVGDTQIDISMLEAAGLSAAPANAMKENLAAADVILNDCEHDCIAQLLEEYVFEK